MKEVFQKVLLFFRDHLAPIIYMIFHHVGRRRKQELEKKLLQSSVNKDTDKGDENDS